MKEKIKSFLKPSRSKIIIFILVLLYSYSFIMVYPWGHNFSPLPWVLFLPLLLNRFFTLILIFPYSYIIACGIISIFNLIKQKKSLVITGVIILFFLLGIDEPLINDTINRPDYSCSVDSDCVVKSISKTPCGNFQCINRDWEYYNSMINSVFALSCRMSHFSCSCVEGRCESKDFYSSTNLEDCENLEGYRKIYCIDVVSRNINKTKE